MRQLILLNGPPRSGKDTLANLLSTWLEIDHIKFAQPLREIIPAVFSIQKNVWEYLLEHQKTTKIDELFGMTPREAMIWASEDVCKPKFGKDFFGKSLVNRIHGEGIDSAVISDSGFYDEAHVLIDEFGAENIRLIRLIRYGCSFTGDSRAYITLPGIPTVDLENNGTAEELGQKAIKWLLTSFGRTPYSSKVQYRF